jgi:tRNA dimethylallyltransferase
MSQTENPTVYVLLGATATGKTSVALELARQLGAELASMDSMKVYRGMDIGTAKPTAEERQGFRWHLLDLVEPITSFCVGDWLVAADAAIADCALRDVPLVFEGGSPLYCRALLEGLFDGPPANQILRQELELLAGQQGVEALHQELAEIDPQAAQRIDSHDLRRIIRAIEVFRATGRPISEMQQQFGNRRPGFDFRVAGIRWPRPQLYQRIDLRVDQMLEAGFLDEVRALRSKYGQLSHTAMQALGYRELSAYLDQQWDWDEAVRLTKRNTRRFSRRQVNWLEKMSGIKWFATETPGLPGQEVPAREAGDQLAARILKEI